MKSIKISRPIDCAPVESFYDKETNNSNFIHQYKICMATLSCRDGIYVPIQKRETKPFGRYEQNKRKQQL